MKRTILLGLVFLSMSLQMASAQDVERKSKSCTDIFDKNLVNGSSTILHETVEKIYPEYLDFVKNKFKIKGEVKIGKYSYISHESGINVWFDFLTENDQQIKYTFEWQAKCDFTILEDLELSHRTVIGKITYVPSCSTMSNETSGLSRTCEAPVGDSKTFNVSKTFPTK